MPMDYFETVGELGLGSRLKRLSDSFMSGSKKAYEAEGYDFEPRWFPLFSLLLKEGQTTVSSAAEKLKITHPHISQIAKELEKSKLANWRTNQNDGRSRTLALTDKGRDLAKQVQPLWDDIKAAAQRVVQEADARFLERLEQIEQSLADQAFERRVFAEKRTRLQKNCEIVAYTPALRAAFEDLNREWIEESFAIESHDIKMFKNPQKEIIDQGGEIIFVKVAGVVAGTCTLLHTDGIYELAKLAVTSAYKGLGLGELLCEEIIARARKKKAKNISLTTNSRLIPAVRLYEKLGFRETSRGQHEKYNRVDLCMELKL